MRVFRSTNLMINIFKPWTKRRNETKLSPHSHEDFEQVSLGDEGIICTSPAVSVGTQQDQMERATSTSTSTSPSVLVIPPRVIHTTQDIGDGTTWLIDIFGPPRVDFSCRPGFVLNAAEYPMPAQGVRDVLEAGGPRSS